MRLPRWAYWLAAGVPFYLGAMYWAGEHYVWPYGVPGRTKEHALMRTPFKELLDSRFAVVSTDNFFGPDADTDADPNHSNLIIYEDGKPLGPAHSPIYHVAVLGMGRYKHWKRNGQSIFVFSSSDNTDPRTNGRKYWAERP